jgi:hypothetical protein
MIVWPFWWRIQASTGSSELTRAKREGNATQCAVSTWNILFTLISHPKITYTHDRYYLSLIHCFTLCPLNLIKPNTTTYRITSHSLDFICAPKNTRVSSRHRKYKKHYHSCDARYTCALHRFLMFAYINAATHYHRQRCMQHTIISAYHDIAVMVMLFV